MKSISSYNRSLPKMGTASTPKHNFLAVLFLFFANFLIALSEAQDLVADLRAKGIDLAAPADQDYKSASAPCEFYIYVLERTEEI